MKKGKKNRSDFISKRPGDMRLGVWYGRFDDETDADTGAVENDEDAE